MAYQFRYRGIADAYRATEATGGYVVQAMIDNVLHNVHYFQTSGSSTFSVVFPGSADRTIKYLVVGGGGSGGDADNETEAGSGGGAGGYREGEITLSSPVDISVSVGSGGIPSSGGGCDVGTDGQASSIIAPDISLDVIAAGGGGGGNGQGGAGRNGGSGGGSGRRTTTFGLGNTPATDTAQ